jgi:hypothetical protein
MAMHSMPPIQIDAATSSTAIIAGLVPSIFSSLLLRLLF